MSQEVKTKVSKKSVTSGSQPIIDEKKSDVSEEELAVWVKDLYNVDQLNDQDYSTWYEAFKYKGFDRREVLKQMKTILNNDSKLGMQLVMLCALQGPQRASRTKLMNGRTPLEYGIVASGQQGSTKISCQRITAATADLAAFFLKRVNAPKRMDVALPGWLQFPSAGAIKMSNNLREQHIEFSKRFSPLIGGIFRDDIYNQMVNNAYIDPGLKLFE